MTPKCINCGDPLKPFRRTTFIRKSIPEGAQNIVEKPFGGSTKFTYQPADTWGPFGDGFFCSKSCGYEMGVKMARASIMRT